ncbi:MAG: pyruvate dehydrogenase (acetyl-transferring) E1 component subunit alpha [Alphaproteobacteria bacterium]|nr:pyruvate dehydrogenase (acetyl-transferring) E1 component subunit alpha [Alphaproteobacteria bacterium]
MHSPEPLPPAAAALSEAHAHALLRQMLRIRRFEERCAELYSAQKIRGFLHLYIGEEAIAAGAMAALEPTDAVLGTYREHGHALARGLSARAVMAEMFGKQEGCSRGRGGSMHLFDAEKRFFGGNAIVAGHLPLAVGLGLAAKPRGEVVACFFGEGAVAEGEFHEALNLATLWGLPVVFCCENNGYAMGTALDRSESQTDLTTKAASYGLVAEAVDGMDVLAVEAATRRAVAEARMGRGPRFLELRTYRFRAHSMFDAQLYRDSEEVALWKKTRDPITLFQARLVAEGLLTDDALAALTAEVEAELEDAVAFAEAGTWEPVAALLTDVTTPWDGAVPTPPPPPDEKRGRMTYRECVRQALREALHADPRVSLMGEDVGAYGGCYAVSKHLIDELGPDRIVDTPLSESGFVGAGVGAALGGLRPIVEVMTVNFSLLALDQILNNAATLRHMSGGQLSVPLVIRMATGAGRQLAAQHSHSLEGYYAHIPGLRVLAPATHADARGMLWSALQDPDPVVIFEHVMLYNREDELPEDAGPVDITRAAVRREGEDLTLMTWGGSLFKCLEAAEQLAVMGVEVEVVDLRVLRPLDLETLLASARKTRRVLVVEEGWRTAGLSAEVAAAVAEGAFYDLDAPVSRLCTAEVPIPYPAHLEQAALPQVDTILAAARALLEGHDG